MAQKYISESRLNIWRTVFALAHVDGVVAPEEIQFMVDFMGRDDFTDHQKQLLMSDVQTPRDVFSLFDAISNPLDVEEFFRLAEEICISDNDFCMEEEEVLERLKNHHESRTKQIGPLGDKKVTLFKCEDSSLLPVM